MKYKARICPFMAIAASKEKGSSQASKCKEMCVFYSDDETENCLLREYLELKVKEVKKRRYPRRAVPRDAE
jgi:hypothetical protein